MPFGSLLVGPAGDVLTEARNTVVTDRDIAAHPELSSPAGRPATSTPKQRG